MRRGLGGRSPSRGSRPPRPSCRSRRASRTGSRSRPGSWAASPRKSTDSCVERFESPFSRSALLVLAGVEAPDRPAGRAVLDRVVRALAERPEVTGTFSYRDQEDAFFVGAGGGTFVVVGLDAGEGRVDRLLPGLRRATAGLQAELRAVHPRATLRWTGQAALNYDLWRSSADATHRAERRTLPLTLALLLFAFGSVAAALLTVASGALAVGLALGAVAVAAGHWPLSILAVNVASMIGLALGIDYALLTVSRFREARGKGALPRRGGGPRGASRGRHRGPLRPDRGDRLPRAPPRAAQRAALRGPRRPARHPGLGPRGGDAPAGGPRRAGRPHRARPLARPAGRRRGPLARLEPAGVRPALDRPARGGPAAPAPGGAGAAPRPPHPARRLAAAVDRVGPGDRRPARDGTRGSGRVPARRGRAARDDDRARARGLGSAAPPRGPAGRRPPRGKGAVAPGDRRRPRRRPRLRGAPPGDRQADLPRLGGGARPPRGRPARGHRTPRTWPPSSASCGGPIPSR